MSVWVWIAIAGIGGLGAIGRFLLDSVVGNRAGRDFPLGTFAVNISGAFLLGLLGGLAVTGKALLILGPAALGSYTTFSTWTLETQRLAEDAEGRGALANILVSLAAGLAAVAVGRQVGLWA